MQTVRCRIGGEQAVHRQTVVWRIGQRCVKELVVAMGCETVLDRCRSSLVHSDVNNALVHASFQNSRRKES